MTANLLNKRTKMLRLGLSFWLGLSASSLRSAELSACLVEPSHLAEVGSAVVGVIDRVTFERGDAVKRGQALVFLKAEVEQAATGLATARSKAEAELRSARSNHEFTQRKLQRSVDLQQQNFISQQALDQARTEAELAEQKLQQARENQRVLHQELALARAQLAQRTIVSPIEGVVLERFVTTGERVEQQTVAKIATLDPLRVEVIVPAVYFNKIQPGMSATIRPDLPEVGERQAKVSLVDRVIDTASNSFRVRLELPNPSNSLPAGVRCKADFGFSIVAKSKDHTINRAIVSTPNAAVVAPKASNPPPPSPAPGKAGPSITQTNPAVTPKTHALPATAVPAESALKPAQALVLPLVLSGAAADNTAAPATTINVGPRKSSATGLPGAKLRLSPKIALSNLPQP